MSKFLVRATGTLPSSQKSEPTTNYASWGNQRMGGVEVHSPAYQQLVADASTRVQTGRLTAYRAANKELIQMYWDLGKMRAFYRAYEQEQFLPPAVGEIGWTHNYLIIES